MKYQILEHTADLKIKVFGKDKKELFENVLIGMFEGAEYKGEDKKVKRKIKVSSSDLPSLLVDFLSEVLYLSETNWEVYHKIQFAEFDDKNLKATLIGKKLERIGVQIKGATWHGLDLHQKKDRTWEATILFDI